MARKPEDVAAAVNGLVVLLLPIGLAMLPALFRPDFTDTSTSVVAADPAGRGSEIAALLATVLSTLAPFVLIAAWRTHVHARRWREQGDHGWRGVAEAGATGFAVALLVLAPGILTRPAQAPLYVIVYGGAALLLGLLVGLLLRATALVTLRALRPTPFA